jgi:chromosome segregation ATPase
VLAWNQATDRAGRARTVAREMAALDSSLAQDRSALAALRAAQAQEPARADALRERIGVLRERLHEQRVRLARLAEFQRAEIEARAVAALQDQKLAVAEYANQARLAVAQLYDRGHQEGADDAPAAP